MPSYLRSKRFWIPVGAIVVILAATGLISWQLLSFPEATPPDTQPASAAPQRGGTITTPRTTPASSTTNATTDTTMEGNEDFAACATEGQTYCSGFYSSDWATWAAANGYTTASWKLGLVDCIEAHRAQNSQACNDSMDRRAALNDDVNTLCAADRRTYCAGVVPQPGSEPQVDCLKDHYSQLTLECAAAVDDHELAKPTGQQDWSYQE